MPAKIIAIPFETDGTEGFTDQGMIQFDPNWDLSASCFVARLGIVVFDPHAATVNVSVGAVQPIDANTQTLIGSWRFGADDSVDYICDLTELQQVYLAKGFSGWRVESSAKVSGIIYLFGDVVACSETIMALVTFDYSSLVNVATGSVVEPTTTRRKTGEF